MGGEEVILDIRILQEKRGGFNSRSNICCLPFEVAFNCLNLLMKHMELIPLFWIGDEVKICFTQGFQTSHLFS